MKELFKLAITNWPAAFLVVFFGLIIGAVISATVKKFLDYLSIRRHGWPPPGITIAGEDEPVITFKMPEGAHFTAEKGKKPRTELSEWIDAQKAAAEQINQMTWPPGTKQYMDAQVRDQFGEWTDMQDRINKNWAILTKEERWVDKQGRELKWEYRGADKIMFSVTDRLHSERNVEYQFYRAPIPVKETKT